MGFRNLLRIFIHPLTALLANLFMVVAIGVTSPIEWIETTSLVMCGLIGAAIIQAARHKEMLSLRAYPTNFGQSICLASFTLIMVAYSQLDNVIWPKTMLWIAAGFLIVTLIEMISRLMFMTNVWTLGSEGYARKRLERIHAGNRANWKIKIDGIIDANLHRSIEHDRHLEYFANMAGVPTPNHRLGKSTITRWLDQ